MSQSGQENAVAGNQKRVTYLLGAGASALALPIVADFPNSLRKFHEELKKYEQQTSAKEYFNDHSLQGKTKSGYFQELLHKITWLADEAEKSASVDTLAKKYHLTGMDAYLRQLKTILTIFFLWEQLPNPPDPRYDAFIASISDLKDRALRIADNLRIISWNYDFQVEKAFAPYFSGAYTSLSKFSSIQERLNIIPRKGNTIEFNDGFGVIKLNGTAALISDSASGARPLFEDMKVDADVQLAEDLTRVYAGLITYNQTDMFLNFAWESTKAKEKILEIARQVAYKTEVLVVLGYSFPFFNREIDRLIINAMGGLKSVYFQAKGDDVYRNIDRFKSIRTDLSKDQLIPIEDVDQFFLPPEL